ncbi:MAG: hypothetical protein LBF63_10620 [Treponema sp.]|jgi:hypothetical protein|nr:hypothetical protein [Treponema sp.]
MYVERPLVLPPLTAGEAAPGLRIRKTLPEYSGTDVYHTLYLPPGWKPGGSYPVIAEYTGNYWPPAKSSGEVQDAAMGYGLSRGERFIVISLPYIAPDHTRNELTWWGDTGATTDYCKRAVPLICKTYGGDMERVCLCGFSRGAIAVNFIGLRDDEIAAYWRCFITNEHFDGIRDWEAPWGAPLGTYRQEARERLKRVQGRPYLVLQNDCPETPDMLDTIRSFVKEEDSGNFTFREVHVRDLPVPHSHTDQWLLFDTEEARETREWLKARMASV